MAARTLFALALTLALTLTLALAFDLSLSLSLSLSISRSLAASLRLCACSLCACSLCTCILCACALSLFIVSAWQPIISQVPLVSGLTYPCFLRVVCLFTTLWGPADQLHNEDLPPEYQLVRGDLPGHPKERVESGADYIKGVAVDLFPAHGSQPGRSIGARYRSAV